MAKILHKGDTSDGLMRGEGKFEIIQGHSALQRQLLYIEVCGRICYRSERRKVDAESADKFVRMIMRRGHESVIEHSSLTVIFSNVSRGFSHECVRHRLCAFSHESTRYVDYAGGKLDLDAAELAFIAPPHKELSDIGWYRNFKPDDADITQSATMLETIYNNLRQSGWQPQDARQFLPIGIATKIAVTANFREWRHIFAMRTQKAAHWEIRYIMCDLLAKLKEIIPIIFEDFHFAGQDKDGYAYYIKHGENNDN